MATMKNLEDALVDELRDILHAEKQLTKALAKMAKKASSEELREAFEEHREVTLEQIERLEKAFDVLGKAPRAKKCEGMFGILEEGKEHLEEEAEPSVLDAVMIADAQKAEHYEIASYGTVIAWAEQLGQNEIVRLLEQTLKEEKETDVKLTELAETLANQEAAV